MDIDQTSMTEPILWALFTLTLFGGMFLFMTIWRVHYLKMVDAEHRFLRRLGIPDRIFASTRRIEQSRGYVICIGTMAFLSLALLITAIALSYRFQASRDLARLWEGHVSDEELITFLDSSDKHLLSNTLTELEHRGIAEGRDRAAKLLTHPDLYVWYCSSLYIGSVGDQRSVPYLIRGLDHPAWRSRPRIIEYLKAMTGQDYGENKEEWIAWWSGQHKDKSFDFGWENNQSQ